MLVVEGGTALPRVLGTSVRVVEIVWELINRDELRPMGGRPEHLLWALFYPKQGPGCSTVGVSNGTIDPKTHRKWVWAFIEAIFKLVDVVVSVFGCCVLFSSNKWPSWQSLLPSMMMTLSTSSPSIVVSCPPCCPHCLTHLALVSCSPPSQNCRLISIDGSSMTSATTA